MTEEQVLAAAKIIARDDSGCSGDRVPCVDDGTCCCLATARAALAVAAALDWQPIETVPDSGRVELFLAHGEKGNGEIAVGMVIRESDGSIPNCYWTWGGPNSGSDIDERPTHWRYLRPFPDGLTTAAVAPI